MEPFALKKKVSVHESLSRAYTIILQIAHVTTMLKLHSTSKILNYIIMVIGHPAKLNT